MSEYIQQMSEYIQQMNEITDTLKEVSNTMIIIANSLLESQKVQQQMISDINRLNDRMDRIEAKLDKVVS